MKNQCPLFADEAIELVRDAEGGICYHPACVPEDVAASQHTHEHGIPKTADGAGPRISLAFRVRLPAV